MERSVNDGIGSSVFVEEDSKKQEQNRKKIEIMTSIF
jgi:hypothetical protein